MAVIPCWMALFIPSAALAAKAPWPAPVQPEHDDHGNPAPVVHGTGSALCQSGVSSGFACKNVEMLSRLELADIGGGSGSDAWGWKDGETGRYYALLARSNGTSFVDVTVPESPVYLGNLPGTSGSQPWRDIKVYRDHAFIVADGIPGHGMQVFDLTRLRGLSGPQEFAVDELYTGVGPVHNVAINEDSGFAYLAGSDQCAGGLHMVDIRSPKEPVFAGCFDEDGYTHDVQCVIYHGPDASHQGSEICFASNEDSLTIVDVTDKQAPVLLGKADYPQVGYSHQGWLSEDHGSFFMGDETDELNFGMNTRTLVFDVSDLGEPAFANAHAHGTSVIDHNMYVKGDYLYQANYLAGLRILRINRGSSVSLSDVAYFDTAPESDELGFGGAWSVYPFFDNGTILVSDMDKGLFVLHVNLEADAAEASPISGRISGAWVSETLNDQGIMLFVDELDSGPVIYFNWFLFLDGEPFWLTGASGFQYGEDTVTIPVQRLSGLDFVQPGPDTATRQDVGTLMVHVHDCREMHVEYDLEGLGSGLVQMIRLAGVQGRGCP